MNLTKFTGVSGDFSSRICKLIMGWTGVGIFCFSMLGCAATNSLLGGNSRKEAVAEIAWDFAEDGIVLELAADPRLNEYGGEAHTLMLGVYQMEDSAAFYKLIADSTVLAKALESGKGEGFVQFSRYVVVPGQRTIMTMGRAQKAKFVGLVAGYYELNPAMSTRLFQIPLTVASDGLVSTTYKAAPAVLALRLNLGVDGVVNAQRLNRDPAEKPKTEAVPLDGGGKEVRLSTDDIKRTIDVGNGVRKLDK